MGTVKMEENKLARSAVSSGVFLEIQLARNLAREIQWVIDSGGVMPVQIRKQFDPLKKFYDECLAEENSIFY